MGNMRFDISFSEGRQKKSSCWPCFSSKRQLWPNFRSVAGTEKLLSPSISPKSPSLAQTDNVPRMNEISLNGLIWKYTNILYGYQERFFKIENGNIFYYLNKESVRDGCRKFRQLVNFAIEVRSWIYEIWGCSDASGFLTSWCKEFLVFCKMECLVFPT